MKRLIAAGMIAAMPTVTWASPLDQFSRVIYFGDSFTDGGAAYDLADEAGVPSLIYPKNQLTNGDVWATQLGGTYVDGTYALDADGFETTNFAVGGAEAVAEKGDVSPDLGRQIDVFQAYVSSGVDLGPNALAFISMGTNDIRDVEDVMPPSGANPEQLEELLFNAAMAISVEVIGAITQGVTDLLASGVSKVAVFGLPDIGIFPSVIEAGLSKIASEFTPVYNDALKLALESGFTSKEAMFIDTFAIFNDIIANAGNLDITKPLDESCVVDFAEIDACIASNPNSYFFYDTVHPTEVVHTASPMRSNSNSLRRYRFLPVPVSCWWVLGAWSCYAEDLPRPERVSKCGTSVRNGVPASIREHIQFNLLAFRVLKSVNSHSARKSEMHSAQAGPGALSGC